MTSHHSTSRDGVSRRGLLRMAGGAAALAAVGSARGARAEWKLPSGNVTATFWDSTSHLKVALYNQFLLPAYKQQRPGYTIKYESISTADLLQKLLAATATGTAPEIFELGDWFFPTYFAKNLLDPVPPEAFGYKSLPEMLDAYVPGSLAAMQHENRLYGVPDFVASHSLYVNNRLFREAGLDPVKDAPKTWDDVARLNKVLTRKKGDQIVQKGFEVRYVGTHWLAMMFHHLIYQAGGEMLDREGRPAFNQEPGVKALEVWKSVTVAPTVTKNSGASPFEDFAQEQDAMTYIGPNGGRQIVTLNPNMKDNFTVVPLPQLNRARPVTMSYSFDIVVNPRVSDEKKKVAWDFVRHAVSDPKIWLANNGSLLPFKTWATSPEARQILPFYDVFISDLAIGRPMVRTEHFNELSSALARAIERVIFSNAEPKPALDQAAAEFVRATRG
jgi:multiple sugar transport system substrate-binding protein